MKKATKHYRKPQRTTRTYKPLQKTTQKLKTKSYKQTKTTTKKARTKNYAKLCKSYRAYTQTTQKLLKAKDRKHKSKKRWLTQLQKNTKAENNYKDLQKN